MNASRILTVSALAAVLGLVACATPVENAEDPTGHTSEALRPRPEGPDGPPPPIYLDVNQCVAQDFTMSNEFELDLHNLGCHDKEVISMRVLVSTGLPVNGTAGFAAQCPTDTTIIAGCPATQEKPGPMNAVRLAQCWATMNPTYATTSWTAPTACTPTNGVLWVGWDPTCHGSGCSIKFGQ